MPLTGGHENQISNSKSQTTRQDVGATINNEEDVLAISIAEYRSLLNDTESTDQQIRERLIYLGNFFRTIIRIELENYDAET